jgi:hypothetical protein
MSQIDLPLPSWSQAPSTWYAAEAEPHKNVFGNAIFFSSFCFHSKWYHIIT